MMNSRRFDVPKFLAKLRPKAIGIDLHWLPHAHGALEVARIAKELHPSVPVIMGGLSSTYFHRELIGYAQVDYVLRGDSTEPPLHQLLLALESGTPLDPIPNLTWKDAVGVHVNPLGFIPTSLDYVDLRPDLMVEMVMRYRDLESTLPFNGWWNNPITTVFTVKGCAFECVTCGSSATTCLHLTKRQKPVYRSPASLVANMQDIARLTHAPILLVGDVLMAGAEHADSLLERLRVADLPNNIVFEFFALPPASFLRNIDRCVRHWSMEFSPESHEQAVRDAQEGESGYSTEDMENIIKEAVSLRCSRIDIFFMIGLPAQTQDSVKATVEYCGTLFKLGDKRLSCFISPMGPFIDPGSRGFEQPERFGYRLFAKTLEQHRQLLIKPTWEHILNYETKWMTRRELVDATYDAAERLNELKIEHGRLSKRRGRGVAAGIAAARALRSRLDKGLARGNIDSVTETLKGEINRFSVSTVCDKRELFWPRRVFNFQASEIARIVRRYFGARIKAPVTAAPPSGGSV
jgi:B12-binding domain/radical SAM domain protein